MSERDNGGPAFPVSDGCAAEPSTLAEAKRNALGMTLRDYFAAKAMQALASTIHGQLTTQAATVIAEDAYYLADAMLKARQE